MTRRLKRRMVDMPDLKDRLIRLGSDNPELRDHIRPILDKLSSKGGESLVGIEVEEELSEKEEQLDIIYSDVTDILEMRELEYKIPRTLKKDFKKSIRKARRSVEDIIEFASGRKEF
jgi:hypothetical protein